jgi:hypothetical protein
MSAEERVRPAHPTSWPARSAMTTPPPTSARSPTASTANPAFTGLRFEVDRVLRLAPPFAWLRRCCSTATRWSRRMRTSSPGRLTHAERLHTHGEHLQRRGRREPALAPFIRTRPQPEAANSRRFRNHEHRALSARAAAPREVTASGRMRSPARPAPGAHARAKPTRRRADCFVAKGIAE